MIRRDRDDRNQYGHSGQRGSYNASRKPHRWHTIKTVIREENNENKLPLKLDAIIEQPEYEDGEKGFCRLITTITVGNYHVRLSFKALRTLMTWLNDKRPALLDAIEEVREINNDYRTKEQLPSRQRPRRSRQIPVDKRDYPLLDNERLDKRRPGNRSPIRDRGRFAPSSRNKK